MPAIVLRMNPKTEQVPWARSLDIIRLSNMALNTDGNVFVSSTRQVYNRTAKGTDLIVHKVNSDGDLLWRMDYPYARQYYGVSPPPFLHVSSSGTVVAAAPDLDMTGFLLIDAATGKSKGIIDTGIQDYIYEAHPYDSEGSADVTSDTARRLSFLGYFEDNKYKCAVEMHCANLIGDPKPRRRQNFRVPLYDGSRRPNYSPWITTKMLMTPNRMMNLVLPFTLHTVVSLVEMLLTVSPENSKVG